MVLLSQEKTPVLYVTVINFLCISEFSFLIFRENQQNESEITLKVEEKTQNEGFRPIIPKPNEQTRQANDANILRNLPNCDESIKIRLAQELFKANYISHLSNFANYFASFEAFVQKRFIAQQIVSLQQTPNSAFNFNFST